MTRLLNWIGNGTDSRYYLHTSIPHHFRLVCRKLVCILNKFKSFHSLYIDNSFSSPSVQACLPIFDHFQVSVAVLCPTSLFPRIQFHRTSCSHLRQHSWIVLTIILIICLRWLAVCTSVHRCHTVRLLLRWCCIWIRWWCLRSGEGFSFVLFQLPSFPKSPNNWSKCDETQRYAHANANAYSNRSIMVAVRAGTCCWRRSIRDSGVVRQKGIARNNSRVGNLESRIVQSADGGVIAGGHVVTAVLGGVVEIWKQNYRATTFIETRICARNYI